MWVRGRYMNESLKEQLFLKLLQLSLFVLILYGQIPTVTHTITHWHIVFPWSTYHTLEGTLMMLTRMMMTLATFSLFPNIHLNTQTTWIHAVCMSCAKRVTVSMATKLAHPRVCQCLRWTILLYSFCLSLSLKVYLTSSSSWTLAYMCPFCKKNLQYSF